MQIQRTKLSGLIQFGALVLLMSASGCSRRWAPIQTGHIGTPELEIVAVDNSFTWRSGFSYPMPAEGRHARHATAPTPDAATTASVCARRGVAGYHYVRVRLGEGPWYNGVLYLSMAHPNWRGPATRSYEFVVPPEQFQNASGGRVSVAFERVRSIHGGEGHHPWILWLSDSRF